MRDDAEMNVTGALALPAPDERDNRPNSKQWRPRTKPRSSVMTR